MPRQTPEDLAQKARFIFEGTIRQRGAATMESVPVNDRTLIVHVDQILQAPRALTSVLGQDITVQLGSTRSKLDVGQQATFYTNGWLFGESIAVQAVGQIPAQGRTAMKNVANLAMSNSDPPEGLIHHDLQKRIANADAVVTGRVTSVRVPESAAPGSPLLAGASLLEAGEESHSAAPISEHDPEWREAVIEVERVEKGVTELSNVVVRFPNSNDVQWYRAPKFEPGQEGVFLLHEKQTLPTAAAGLAKNALADEEDIYVALDPADFQPSDRLPMVQSLIAADDQTVSESNPV